MQSFLLDVIAKSKSIASKIERKHELYIKEINGRLYNDYQ